MPLQAALPPPPFSPKVRVIRPALANSVDVLLVMHIPT